MFNFIGIIKGLKKDFKKFLYVVFNKFFFMFIEDKIFVKIGFVYIY